MKKWYVVLAVVFCLLTFLLVSCGREVKDRGDEGENDRVPLDVSDLNLPDLMGTDDTKDTSEDEGTSGGDPATGTDLPPESGEDEPEDATPTDLPQAGDADEGGDTLAPEIETQILEIYGSSLEYVSHGDGTCSVSGIGECKDVCVLIPEKNAAGEVVTGIEKGAFAGAVTLTALQIPSTVLMIGQRPFDGCTGLVYISVAENNPAFCDINGVLYNKEGSMLLAYPPARAFSELELGTAVTTIANGAFKNCPYLKTIRYGGTEAEWGEILIGAQNNALYAASVIFWTDGK